MWITSHIGIEVNEKAYQLAKAAKNEDVYGHPCNGREGSHQNQHLPPMANKLIHLLQIPEEYKGRHPTMFQHIHISNSIFLQHAWFSVQSSVDELVKRNIVTFLVLTSVRGPCCSGTYSSPNYIIMDKLIIGFLIIGKKSF